MKPEQAEARKLATFLETGQTLAELTAKGRDFASSGTLDRHHGMMRGVVMLLDPDTLEMRITASHGLDETGVRESNTDRRRDNGPGGRDGQAVVVPQVSREPMFSTASVSGRPGSRDTN